jgi:hypothetical protein
MQMRCTTAASISRPTRHRVERVARGVLVRHAGMRNGEGDAGHAAQFRADRDICDAYLYLLGRLLVLRQERRDLERGAEWNQLILRDPGPDLACGEAWIAVDESSCTTIELPEIRGRYYTVHVVNPWGETIANLNERTCPDHPYGIFALCLKDSAVRLPDGARRLDLPGRKAHVNIHVALRASAAVAMELLRGFAVRATGNPVIPATVGIPAFTDDALPGVEVFDSALAVIATEPDVNRGTETVQAKVRAAAARAADRGERARIDRVIRQRSWGLHQALYTTRNDWVTPRLAGNYGPDWLARTAANMFELWSNTKSEVARFRAVPLDGSETYAMRFDRAAPIPQVRHFWSVGVSGATSDHGRVTSQSEFHRERNGTLVLYFAPTLPSSIPHENWIQTPGASKYRVDWHSYGTPPADWVPPSFQKITLNGQR